MGFNILESENLHDVKWWFAGSPLSRANAINKLFANPEVKAIMVHDGGQSAITILEYLDYELISKNPKPFIGFSDITNVLSAIYTKSNLSYLYGPLITDSFGIHWKSQL